MTISTAKNGSKSAVQYAQICTRSTESLVRFPVGGLQKLHFFSAGLGWVMNCMIRRLKTLLSLRRDSLTCITGLRVSPAITDSKCRKMKPAEVRGPSSHDRYHSPQGKRAVAITGQKSRLVTLVHYLCRWIPHILGSWLRYFL